MEMKRAKSNCVVFLSCLSLLAMGGCETSYRTDLQGKLAFKPLVPIDTGVPLPNKVSLAIAPFTDQRPFIEPNKPMTYHCINFGAKGFDVYQPVDWSVHKSYEGIMWECTQEKTSDLIRDILVDVYNKAGFDSIPIDSTPENESNLLAEARSKKSEFLLTGNIKHFQTADHCGAVGGFYYLHQTIEFEVKLLRVKDGKCLLSKTFALNSEETNAGNKYYSMYKIVQADILLLNVRLPQILNRMISDSKETILKNN